MVRTRTIAPRRLAGVVQIIRPLIVLQGMGYTLVGAYVGAGLPAYMWRVGVAALVVGLVVAFGCVVNDYCDLEVDRLGKPERPLPSGSISRRTAGVVILSCAGGALITAATLGPVFAVFALGTILVSGFYSYRLKSTVLLGNLTQALLAASTVVYGSLAAGAITRNTAIVTTLTALYMFAFEIIHTAVDRDGDRRAGLTTAATVLGLAQTVRIYEWSVLVTIAVGVLFWAIGWAPDRYLFALLPCSILPTASAALIVREHTTPYSLDLARRIMKLVWISTLLPILLLR